MISSVIDHSSTLGTARHQGQRLTCLAFAVSDVNRRLAPAPDVLSAEFLYQHAGAITPGWAAGGPLYLAPALKVADKPGQPLEADYPYQPTSGSTVAIPVQPTGAQMYRYGLREIKRTSDAIVAELQHGQVVGLIIESTATLMAPINGIVAFSPMILPGRAHAVVAVGLGETAAGQRYVRIRNSWGTNWGDQGHAWLPIEYIDLHTLQAFGR
jgi:C1A family cysteine protease